MKLRLAAASTATVLVVLALVSDHLSGAGGLLVTSTLTGAVLTAGLAVQPLLVVGGRGVQEHRILGTGLVALAAGHVGALFLLAPDDALFAMSPDGPTRARMALIAIVALLLAATLAAIGPRTRWDRRTWRLVHAYLGLCRGARRRPRGPDRRRAGGRGHPAAAGARGAGHGGYRRRRQPGCVEPALTDEGDSGQAALPAGTIQRQS